LTISGRTGPGGQRRRAPEESCCSNYLKTIQYLGKVLASLPATEQKLLFVVGDLIEERSHRPLVPTAEAENEDSRDAFTDVEVHLICPSGHTDPEAAHLFQEFWTRYFEERGARVFHHTLAALQGWLHRVRRARRCRARAPRACPPGICARRDYRSDVCLRGLARMSTSTRSGLQRLSIENDMPSWAEGRLSCRELVQLNQAAARR